MIPSRTRSWMSLSSALGTGPPPNTGTRPGAVEAGLRTPRTAPPEEDLATVVPHNEEAEDQVQHAESGAEQPGVRRGRKPERCRAEGDEERTEHRHGAHRKGAARYDGGTVAGEPDAGKEVPRRGAHDGRGEQCADDERGHERQRERARGTGAQGLPRALRLAGHGDERERHGDGGRRQPECETLFGGGDAR